MKFRNIKFSNIIRKGMALTLAASMFAGLLPALPAKAADYSVTITEDITKKFKTYMEGKNFANDDYNESKDRVVALSQFLTDKKDDGGLGISSIKPIPQDDRDDYETNKVVWNPKQDKVDDHRDLYFLQWANGKNYRHPESGYEILCRIAYITTSGEIRYSKKVNVDDYPRSLQGLSDYDQWKHGIVNQCYFAMPDDCAQIIGIFLGNQSGGGNNNNEWYMDYLTISRITSDKVSDISTPADNGQGYKVSTFKNGELVGLVSKFDIDQKYLNTFDVDQEWLYLLQTPDENTQSAALSGTYFAQIITDSDDLSDNKLQLKIHYTDIYGENHSTDNLSVNDDTVSAFYPKLDFPTGFDTSNGWSGNDFYYATNFKYTTRYIPYRLTGGSFAYNNYSMSRHDDKPINGIAFEVEKKDGAKSDRDVFIHLENDGSFHSYSWEDDNTTITNFHAAYYMGNYVPYENMKEDILGAHTATDIPLNIPHIVKEITKIEIITTGSSAIQDIRIYNANPSSYTRTRMNGGLSTERIFCDVENAFCIASLDTSYGKPIQLSGTVTCVPNPSSYDTQHEYKLLQKNQSMSLMAEDDNLGVQISIADLYDAGFDLFMKRYKTDFDKPRVNDWPEATEIHYLSQINMYEMRNVGLKVSTETKKFIDKNTAMELFNILENYYKESLTLNIEYWDDFGALRKVEVPFITSYLMQIYSDNGGKLGTGENDQLTGIIQQGQDVALRVPLSQYSDIRQISLTLGSSPDGIMNLRNILWYYEEAPGDNYDFPDGGSHAQFLEYYVYKRGGLKLREVLDILWSNETIRGGIQISPDETFTIRAIRLYNNVTKEEFHNVYDNSKRIVTLSNSRTNSDYYYAAKDKNGYTLSYGTTLKLSLEDNTLLKGSVDYTKQDLDDIYLVEILVQNLNDMSALSAYISKDLYVTLAYTTTSGEEKKIQSKRLSSLAMDYNGKNQMKGITLYDHDYEYQTERDLKNGAAYFTVELDDVARFDYIYLSLPSGEIHGIQINNINIYEPESISQRYSSPSYLRTLYGFNRDFTGNRVAFNNKPTALQPNREGSTFYFTKINSDGTMEEPDTNITYNDEYLTTPPTSMTYEETLKNLGLAITKYTYNVDVKVANVLDAGSSNYFYFQLVFENGTSGVVLANQQLASDSFRQGYTESFTIHTTQNYGNVTGVRVICDTSSSTSQAFDKLNIETISVTLPNNGSAKSWIIDKVGWIDINFQDEGVATTVSEDGTTGGFPNSQVVKEFARTRTASTARLLFNIATSADSTDIITLPFEGAFEASLVYVDTAGYTQNYNFDLRSAIYEFNESQSPVFIFRKNTTDHFTLSINDISSVKALNIYRSGGTIPWTIKDISISQFTELGNVYKTTSGEFTRYIEGETLLTTSTNGNVMINGVGNATFTFADNSIVMDVATTDPSTWTTTITRIPTSTQESLNVYLYAGSNDNRTYSFNTANLPSIKGRMEYTLKEGGSTLGSNSFTFNDYTSINGTTVLKATGIKTSGMNQLKTLHLETSSGSSPIISGARVERVRENTIIETLYFDFTNTAMEANHTYSAIASKDTLSSATKQTVALQLTSGQQQLITSTSDIAVALKYTTESNAGESSKALYTSPYVFFTDVGITSLGNTSILEIPFEVSGADQIVGISIVSTGPNVKFENAIVYNYVTNAIGEKVMVDICQIAESFSTSTVEKQLMEDTNSNVTPVTFTFTTSADGQFPGAGTSGRLPLLIHYKTIDGKDGSLQFENLTALLPANTLPTAGSTVSFNVQLSNFSHLTSMVIGATDDDWHLNKVSAEIKKLNNALSTSYKVEAFVNQWITSKTSATAVFTGNEAQNSLNEIVSFSVTGKTSKSANVATATSGNVLTIKATPGENVTFTPQITATGNPVNNVIWDTSKYASYMTDSGNVGLTFRVPDNSIGQVYSFTGYCSFDTQKSVTITIQVVDNVPDTPGGGTTGDDTTDSNTTTEEIAVVNAEIAIENDNNKVPGPSLPQFSAENGTNQTYTIFVKPRTNTGTWKFDSETNSTDYTVTFTPSTLSVSDAAQTYTTTMTCKKGTDEIFNVTFNVIVKDLTVTATLYEVNGTTETPIGSPYYYNFDALTASANNVIRIPYETVTKTYKIKLAVNDTAASAIFAGTGNELTSTNVDSQGNVYKPGTVIKNVTLRCAPTYGTGFTLPITIKVADSSTTTP